MLTIPKILDTPDYLLAPLKCKWNKDIASEIYTESEDGKLLEEVKKISHKALLGFSTALGEWIFWRLSESRKQMGLNLDTHFNIIKADWAGAIDKHYFYAWEFENKNKDGVVAGALWIALNSMEFIRNGYIFGSYFASCGVVGVVQLTTLARHIMPNPYKETFNNWISDCLKILAQHYPCSFNVKEFEYEEYKSEFYDSTNEEPVPRELFFDENYTYDKENNSKFLNRFLSGLDYENNEFLNSPEEMIKEGFKGTPYQYELR